MSDLLDTPTDAQNRALTVVALEFWTDYENSNGELVAVDWVRWGKRGDNSTIVVEKVARVSKPLDQTASDGSRMTNPVWAAIQARYRAWKEGQALPDDGMPLDAWAGLSKAQAKAFKGAGFQAVEHIALMTDADLNKVRLPDVRRVRDLARAFVQSRDRDAPIEAKIAERDARIERQAAEMAEMRESLAAATAAIKRLGDDPAPKRAKADA